MAKIKVLFVNEFSQLATGFATYAHYLLPRLHATGKFEIAELAIYASPLHPLIEDTPWKVYPNEPDPRNPDQVAQYQRDPRNQFGIWKLEEVLLDFQPDVVYSIRDPWMDDFISKSPYRKHFKWVQMPTCDGEPQKPEWLDLYQDADVLLTYSKWAKEVLERQSGGKLKVFDVASPGLDTSVFKPMDKSAVRSDLGLEDDLFIVQTVMRNQPRKLFPELMKMFVKYLEICEANGQHDLASKSFLYFHTTHPDVGWDLPQEIKRHNLSHKVLFTYMCHHCQNITPAFFRGENAVCRNCKQGHLNFPNTAIGVSRENLAKIMASADMYVQYSICLAPDQDVLTKRGWVPIQDINPDDRVWTHKGVWQPVIGGMRTPLGQRKLVEIVMDSDFETLKCTEEHPVFALQISGGKATTREKCGSLLRHGKELPEPQFVPASSLRKGDLIASKIDDSIKDIDKIDLVEFAPYRFYHVRSRNQHQ